MVFSEGMSFGERAMMDGRKRAGTVVTRTDCHYAVVGRDAYDRLLKKDQETKILEKIAFMKNIVYMKNWKSKEIQDLEPFCKEVRYELRDQIIVQEGTASDRIIIVVSGEVEIVKKDLTSCFFNEKTGLIGVQEIKPNGKLVKSTTMLQEEDEVAVINQAPGVSGVLNYSGSDFAMSVQSFLR